MTPIAEPGPGAAGPWVAAADAADASATARPGASPAPPLGAVARPAPRSVSLLLLAGLAVAPFDRSLVERLRYPLGGFIAHGHPFHHYAFEAVRWTFAALVPWAALGCWSRAPRGWFLRPAASRRFLVGGLLGLGLAINVAAKSCWGRPRPKQVLDFGGLERYGALWQPRFGEHGTSFVSGHSAGVALLLALAWLVESPRARRALLLALVPAWLWVSTARVAAGAHFPSDVLIGSWLALAPFPLLDRWLGPVDRVPHVPTRPHA